MGRRLQFLFGTMGAYQPAIGVTGAALSSLAASRTHSVRNEGIPRNLGPEFAPLLARWYDDMRYVSQINGFVDDVVLAFKRYQANGKQPNTQGWCQYQHDLFEQMCSKRAA
jgi:hypothetical protein